MADQDQSAPVPPFKNVQDELPVDLPDAEETLAHRWDFLQVQDQRPEVSPASPPARPSQPAPPERPSEPETESNHREMEFPKVAPFIGDPLDFESVPAQTVSETPLPAVQRDRANRVQDAIQILREKMAAVAMEFAEGRINQAQFEAVYERVQEQRAITESLLARDPKSNAWQNVITEGSTTFLRKRFEAALKGYVLYLNRLAKPILRHGEIAIASQVLMATLKRLRAGNRKPGVAQFAKVADDRWLVYVPGQHTTAIALYENEPPSHHLQRVSDLHRDFETANREQLVAEPFSPEKLVFPQRTLFDEA